MARVRVAPSELAERLGLSLASELVPGRETLARGAAPATVHPVTADLAPLLPAGGLTGQIAIPSRLGATALLWRLLAGPSRAGRWCAVVGVRGLYPLAAAAAGAALDRLALVDVEGAGQTLAALDALCEGVPAIAVSTAGLTARQVQRAAARARRSGTVLIWREATARAAPAVDVRLVPEVCQWRGLRENAGLVWGPGGLDSCWLLVAATWRGNARPHRGEVWPYGEGHSFGGETP